MIHRGACATIVRVDSCPATGPSEGNGPPISVLLPAFDAAGTLAAALRSVQRQTYANWECVIVDDGSRDATAEIAASFAARDERFTLLRTPHRGLVAALHAGLDRCRGAWVARMDADDLMHRERLACQVATMTATPELSGVGCHVWCFPRADLRAGRRAYERWLNAICSPADVEREAFVECPLAHPTLMLKREVLCAFGYSERDVPEDYDLVLRLLGAGHRLGVVPRRLHAWRDAPDRLSRRSPCYTIEAFTRCKAEHLATGFLAPSDRYVLWGYGGTGRALRRELARHGKRPSHIVEMHPRRLGECIHGAPVIAPEALAALGRQPLVASVAGAAARGEIRAFLGDLGYRELRDFVCAA